MSEVMKYVTLVILLLAIFAIMWTLKDGFPRGGNGQRQPIVERRAN